MITLEYADFWSKNLRSDNFRMTFGFLQLNQKIERKYFSIPTLAYKMGQIIKIMAHYRAN